MTMYTKRHFEQIGETLGRTNADASEVNRWVRIFENDNPRFDKDIFLQHVEKFKPSKGFQTGGRVEKKYEVIFLGNSGETRTKIMTESQARRHFGSDEWLEVKGGYLPNIIVAPADEFKKGGKIRNLSPKEGGPVTQGDEAQEEAHELDDEITKLYKQGYSDAAIALKLNVKIPRVEERTAFLQAINIRGGAGYQKGGKILSSKQKAEMMEDIEDWVIKPDTSNKSEAEQIEDLSNEYGVSYREVEDMIWAFRKKHGMLGHGYQQGGQICPGCSQSKLGFTEMMKRKGIKVQYQNIDPVTMKVTPMSVEDVRRKYDPHYKMPLTNKHIKPKGKGHWERRLDHSIARIKGAMKKWRK